VNFCSANSFLEHLGVLADFWHELSEDIRVSGKSSCMTKDKVERVGELFK
jgi:hypothetical protein